jgi:hypothetical protein
MLATALACSLALSAAAASKAPLAEPPVLTRAYSHNDYEQNRALFDAVDRGFMGVEADCHLRGDEFFVAHTGGGIKPGRTLRSLYLDPLLARVRANGGRVYRGGPKGFLLMVEFKSDGDESYPVLEKMLEPYREMLTTYYADHIEEGAVTIVITGHRPNDLLRVQSKRWAGIDGDLGDLGEDHPTLFPTISDSWQSHFEWRWGRMDETERHRLARYVERAHAKGRKIRFYAIPDREEAWELLLNAGVDYINTDHVEDLRRFMSKRFASRRLPSRVVFDGR